MPGAVELALGVRVPDGAERRELPVRQVAGVLQHGVLDAAHALRGILVAVAARLVPQAFPDLVERVGHPGDDAEAVRHAFGVRAVLGDARVNPAGPVPGDDADGGALFVRQCLEEQVEHVPADPVVRPDHPVPLVIDDHGQIRVALAAAGLAHADHRQAVERRGHRGDQLDPPAAEVLVAPASHAAAPVVTMTASAASGASEHAPARAHADLEHGLGTQRRVDDPRVLDDHAFDVEKLFEYAVHRALCGCLFILVENILPGKRSSLTPSTAQRRTHTHQNSNSAILKGVALSSRQRAVPCVELGVLACGE